MVNYIDDITADEVTPPWFPTAATRRVFPESDINQGAQRQFTMSQSLQPAMFWHPETSSDKRASTPELRTTT
jgi:hypothetical protein